jgi:S1-C subfamily serine protease
MVVRCGNGWVAVAHDSVQKLLQQQFGPEAVIWMEFGVHTREPSEAERKVLRLRDAGLFVGEVRRASPAANMGLHPGDLLLVGRPEELLSEAEEISLIRDGIRMTLPVSPPYSLERQQEGAVLTSVHPNTRLAQAGLQPGDRILDPRALSSRDPVWLIFRRDEREMGVLLP